jgi:hypothetical protein
MSGFLDEMEAWDWGEGTEELSEEFENELCNIIT